MRNIGAAKISRRQPPTLRTDGVGNQEQGSTDHLPRRSRPMGLVLHTRSPSSPALRRARARLPMPSKSGPSGACRTSSSGRSDRRSTSCPALPARPRGARSLKAFDFVLSQADVVDRFGIEFAVGEYGRYQKRPSDIAAQAGISFEQSLLDADQFDAHPA